MKRSKEKCAYHCEIEAAFAVIGGKWKAGIIWHIGKERPRFNELRLPLGTISPRMLAKRAARAEADGLVIRTMSPDPAPCRIRADESRESYHPDSGKYQ